MALSALVALALVAEAWWVVSRWDSRSPAPQPEAAPAVVRVPTTTPAGGVLVRSRFRSDGSMRVTQWVRPSALVLGELSLSVDDQPVTTSAGAVLRDLRVSTDALLPPDVPDRLVAGQDVDLPFYSHVEMVRLDYVVEGAVARSTDSAPGRALAALNLVHVDAPGLAGGVVFETSGADVQSMACSDPAGQLQPCGRPAAGRWQVSRPSSASARPVVAVVDLPQA